MTFAVKKGAASKARAAVPRWELFAHDADIGVRGFGNTPSEAFEQAAIAMTAVICDPGAVIQRDKVELSCTAGDLDLLFFDWLNALVLEMATRTMLFGAFEVSIDDGRLAGAAFGEPVDVRRHKPAAEVKGPTFTELRVCRNNDNFWQAQCVLDV